MMTGNPPRRTRNHATLWMLSLTLFMVLLLNNFSRNLLTLQSSKTRRDTSMYNLLSDASTLSPASAVSASTSVSSVPSMDEDVYSQGLLRATPPQQPTRTTQATHESTIRTKTSRDDTDEPAQRKPKLLLHFGPMKTGTTTLQYELHHLLGEELEHDGWHYITSAEPVVQIDVRKTDPNDVLESFIDGISSYGDKSTDIIFSREQYSDLFGWNPGFYKRLYESTLMDQFEVEFAFGYRVFYEWLPSIWYQSRRNLLDEKVEESGPWHDQTTGELSRVIPIFDERYYYWWNPPDHNDIRFTQALVKGAEPYFPVSVFDIRAQPSRSKFVCDILGTAKKACAMSQALDADESIDTTMNQGHAHDIHYMSVALCAARRGLVNIDQHTRKHVWKAVKVHAESTLQWDVTELPYLCPDDDFYADLLHRSLTMDQQLLPEGYGPEREAMLKEGFQRKIDGHTYCVLDAEQVLNKTEWIDFFSANFA